MSRAGSSSSLSLQEIQRARRLTRRSINRLRDSLTLISKKPTTVESCNELEATLIEFNAHRAEYKRLTDQELEETDFVGKSQAEIEKFECDLYKEIDDNINVTIKYSSLLKSLREGLSVTKSRDSL